MNGPHLSASIQHLSISDIVEEQFMHLFFSNYQSTLPSLNYVFIVFLNLKVFLSIWLAFTTSHVYSTAWHSWSE